ncbi:DUF1223 domain-containing protein [Shewanella sp. NIFS-20-20]|uniref:DUF1223 domain-containing protein n=1 Tax=Shewanella sp. NIFS-20-20 TaxID=2853806 RepID=UPI001C43FD65|nr:DUF1223 domain-containing protein [Shewanella sp. NIFS-20-20]MBV7315664.1 DUF1223 domain-containing protein [Shewanella sp. NIFS-20-20]
MWRVQLLIAGLIISLNVGAEQCQQSKSQQPLQWIELFTSQGCSSCPPADAWLNRWRDDPLLWHSVFPLAFHVSYWNYLGWHDPYSSSEFSERQYLHLNQRHTRNVYTPQILINAQEWRGWQGLLGYLAPSPTARVAMATNLGLCIEANDLIWTIDHAYQAPSGVTLHMAIVGMGLETSIARGENRGKILAQDFVVLLHQQQALTANQGTWQWQPKSEWPQQQVAVLWLEDQARVLAAVGQPLTAGQAL